ncbi:hypothetical protein EJ04DRAFT_582210 [Polyplosphaeria fusca]|uniref:JmjC domain-containing histone demethylation protein 1 n=1 Tax=Polyplosphaeria fusca TaxID=682080 RepID=A0A9P4QK63_9PLEO|nr:hypothetical protein EJ04DRAFT_582210 [Polyplosphaeria fusca]
MRGASFKAQYRQAPLRAGTPPPPAYEPLSPVLQPSIPLPRGPSDRNYKRPRRAERDASRLALRTPVQVRVGRAQYPTPAASGYEAPLRSAPLPHGAHYPPALGSPIDALATAAVSSIHPSPRHPYADPHYAAHERPSKRARSEFFPSPQNGQQQSRPATSHMPGPLSYNVEQMADSRTRLHQGDHPLPQSHDNSSKRLSDAQLLLDFSAGASWSAHGHAIPKRWSISHTERLQDIPAETRRAEVDPEESHAPASPNRPPTIGTKSSEPAGHTIVAPTVQIRTPPEDSARAAIPTTQAEPESADSKKPKKHQGWPKGKPRGPRTSLSSGKRKKSIPKTKSASTAGASGAPKQLQSPQSLPADVHDEPQQALTEASDDTTRFPRDIVSHTRRHSFSNPNPSTLQSRYLEVCLPRARSVPLDTIMAITPPTDESSRIGDVGLPGEEQTICAGCNSTDSDTLIGEGEQWINCDGCKAWFHFACAGFKSEFEVRDVNKFYCGGCSPKYGKTTKVRKSGRAHTAVDYAGLHEGIMKSSDHNPEHHYIQGFKNGDIVFERESFARIPPELVTAEYFEKTNGFKEPVVITAASNPRRAHQSHFGPPPEHPSAAPMDGPSDERCGYELTADDGQDKIDMVIPPDLTVRRVTELYGPLERVPVIDVKAQEGESAKWTMAKWADYYEQPGDKPVRNVISLEVSQSRLGRLVRRPRAVRHLDLQDAVWPEDDRINAPKVQFYCLMSVADCYTDFHIDFGGSSVYYHIVKGRKTFFFIRPTKQNLKKYEDWCLSPRQSHEFLGDQVKECYRVDLYPGDTMLIPSGWIHAVWTPEDSLVIGGNFLTRIHYGMQIKVAEVEKNTKVAKMFRYPFFQKIMWFTLLRYLQDDPLPASVEQLLLTGSQFTRPLPVYCQPNEFGHSSDSGDENYNNRYYSQAELEGLPELVNYIWRTVMISLGKIEGITQTTKNAVTRSIPKGHGEPLTLARKFAMWIAWKRGNESIPQWAHPDTQLADMSDAKGEKKLSAAQVRRLERESSVFPPRERQSSRLNPSAQSPPIGSETPPLSSAALPLTGFLGPMRDSGKFHTTPKTSQLGPKRIACDACRKRRIRCKHKDDVIEAPKWEKPPAGPINGSVGTGPMTSSWSLGHFIPRRASDAGLPPNIDPLLLASDPITSASPISPDVNYDGLANRSGRVKACPDCRKSKRRCIHDENGNIDPVKASEAPVPRNGATKKRRVSEGDEMAIHRSKESFPGDTRIDGKMSQDPFRIPSRSLFGLDSSAMVLDDEHGSSPRPASSGELIQVANDAQLALEAMNTIPNDRDAVISSIEHSNIDPALEGMVYGKTNNAYIEDRPVVEPLTPEPFSAITSHGTKPMDPMVLDDTDMAENNNVDKTPKQHRASKAPSSARKSQTPKTQGKKSATPRSIPGGRGRYDSKETISGPLLGTAVEIDDKVDQASLELALKLQMEEHGLRRRSK